MTDIPAPKYLVPDADKPPVAPNDGPDPEPPRSTRYVPGSANGHAAPTVPIRFRTTGQRL